MLRLGPHVGAATSAPKCENSFYSNSSEGGDEIPSKRNVVNECCLPATPEARADWVEVLVRETMAREVRRIFRGYPPPQNRPLRTGPSGGRQSLPHASPNGSRTLAKSGKPRSRLWRIAARRATSACFGGCKPRTAHRDNSDRRSAVSLIQAARNSSLVADGDCSAKTMTTLLCWLILLGNFADPLVRLRGHQR
jgi:hypothetical protein